MENSNYACLNRAQLSYDYLHTNSTTHEFLFGALAELLDNARDASATKINIYTVSDNNLRGGYMLCFADDGQGMSNEECPDIITFGKSTKKSLESQIGMYGNGLKSGSMRIGNDFLLLTKKGATMTCVFLSRTFHEDQQIDEVIVPMPSFDSQNKRPLAKTVLEKEKHQQEMEIILKYSPFTSESALLKEFDKIDGPSGTLVIIYNMKLLDCGESELDVSSQPYDIVLANPTGQDFDTDEGLMPEKKSFRAYTSILYVDPRMRVYIQGKKVQTKRLANCLYKPRMYKYSSSRFKHRSEVDLKKAQEDAKTAENKAKEAESKARNLEVKLASSTNKDQRAELRKVQLLAAEYRKEAMLKKMAAERKLKLVREPKTLMFVFGMNIDNRQQDGMFVYNCSRLIKMYQKVGAHGDGGDLCRGIVGFVDVPYLVLEPTHNKQDFADAKEYRFLLQAMSEHMMQYCRDINLAGQGVTKFWNSFGYTSSDWKETASTDQKYIRKRAMQVPVAIQCDLCLKWRILPFSSNNVGKVFPDDWICSMNPDPSHNRCSVSEEKFNMPEGFLKKVTKSKEEKEKLLELEIRKKQEQLEKLKPANKIKQESSSSEGSEQDDEDGDDEEKPDDSDEEPIQDKKRRIQPLGRQGKKSVSTLPVKSPQSYLSSSSSSGKKTGNVNVAAKKLTQRPSTQTKNASVRKDSTNVTDKFLMSDQRLSRKRRISEYEEDESEKESNGEEKEEESTSNKKVTSKPLGTAMASQSNSRIRNKMATTMTTTANLVSEEKEVVAKDSKEVKTTSSGAIAKSNSVTSRVNINNRKEIISAQKYEPDDGKPATAKKLEETDNDKSTFNPSVVVANNKNNNNNKQEEANNNNNNNDTMDNDKMKEIEIIDDNMNKIISLGLRTSNRIAHTVTNTSTNTKGNKMAADGTKNQASNSDNIINNNNNNNKVVNNIQNNNNNNNETTSVEIPSSSSGLNEDIANGYRTCLRYFLPPQWVMDKDSVSGLSLQELASFPLDNFFDHYERGLKKLVSSFQFEAHSKTNDCEMAKAKLYSLRKLIAKLLKSINEDFDIDLESNPESDQVDELLSLCVKQAFQGTAYNGAGSDQDITGNVYSSATDAEQNGVVITGIGEIYNPDSMLDEDQDSSIRMMQQSGQPIEFIHQTVTDMANRSSLVQSNVMLLDQSSISDSNNVVAGSQ